MQDIRHGIIGIERDASNIESEAGIAGCNGLPVRAKGEEDILTSFLAQA
jgi:hypothetical protein